MKRQLLKIDHLKKIQNAIFAMTLTGDCSEISAPGQFINIKLDGFYLRRPISIYSFGPDFLTIIFKVVGEGTKALAEMQRGEFLDVLMPLGNGFDTTKGGKQPLLVGGGIGVPPFTAWQKTWLTEESFPRSSPGSTEEMTSF